MDVDAAAAQVYGAPLDEFVISRDTLAHQATDRDTAARIRGLRKPTVAAWLVNQLARRYPDQLGTLPELGAEMRAATASRDGRRLRELSAEGRTLVGELTRHARRLADEAGQAASTSAIESLETTLHTAMAHPEAAQVVLAGRLTKPLGHAGFGSADALGRTDPAPARQLAHRSAARPPGDTTVDGPDLAAAREAAQALIEQRVGDHDAAVREVAAARAALSSQRDALDQAIRELDDAESQVQRLQRELAAAQGRATKAQDMRNAAQAAAERAERDVAVAEDELDEASAALTEARAAAAAAASPPPAQPPRGA
ncbi:hypothetical protein [Phytoactinopolyspora limicola]|uniref:hypothetical protein n=1 Tax=Phytoactinopolyspora limicola TaxID=2715536 RepID=UPI001407EB89|nr:hypothetical protein [Phytoactinopolyspora limicola]